MVFRWRWRKKYLMEVKLHIQHYNKKRDTATRCFLFNLLILFLWINAYILVLCSKGTPARWRDFHSATIIGTKMYVFGGRADRFGPFHSNNELYCNLIRVFETVTNTWLDTPMMQPLIEGRRSHSACKTQNMLPTLSTCASCVVDLNDKTRNWIFIVYYLYAVAYNGELYIFGGYNARLDRHFNDLWKFNPGEVGKNLELPKCN